MQYFTQAMKPFEVLDQIGNAIECNSKEYAIATIENAARYFNNRAKNQGKAKLGYSSMSKSFEIIQSYANSGASFASNYVLNVSSGHRYDGAIVARINALPITRGSFVAVTLPRTARTSRSIQHDNPEHRKRVQSALKGSNAVTKAFACPGLCGSCTSSRHACGSMKFKGITIGIAVH